MTEEKHFQRKTTSFAAIGRLKMLIILLIALFVNAGTTQLQAQNRLTLNLQNVTLEQAISSIEKQTDYRFLYNKSLVNVSQKVSINANNQSIDAIVSQLLRGTGVGYTITDRQIVLQPASQSAQQNAPQQTALRNVTGNIVDNLGEPVIGATVVVRGDATKGTVTDYDGNFSLSGVPQNAIISVSYVGYQSMEFPANSPQLANIVLREDSELLDEVVVVGCGTQSKVKATGALSQVKAESFSDMPIVNVQQGLAAQMPGVQVLQNSGAPGGGTSIRVRGLASISADNQPLYVVDGFPVSSSTMHMLNPNDVESIDVLKDAAAAAIYGSRGGNGVVIITTKKGKSGKPKFGFEAYYGLQQVTKKMDMMDAYEYAEFIASSRNNNWLEANPNNKIDDPNSKRPAYMQIPDFIQPYLRGEKNLTNIDWQDAIFRTAPMQSYSFNVSGMNEMANYYVSANYLSQDGIVVNSDYERYSARINLETRFSEKIKFGLNFSPSYSITNSVSEGVHGNDGVVTTAIIAHPMFPVYNEDGTFALGNQSREAIKYSMAAVENPVAVANLIDNKKQAMKLLGNLTLDVNLLDNLKFKSLIGIDYYNRIEDYYRPSVLGLYRSAPPSTATGSSTTGNSVNWAIENTLTYIKQIDDHSFNFLAGHTAQKETIRTNYVRGTGFPNDDIHTLSAATIVNSGNSRIAQWSLISYLARVQYDYKAKYLLSASMRRDGSSRFGKDNRWGWFPSVSWGWRISEEDFFPENNVVNELKLRASYGKTGNFDIPNYASHALLQQANYSFNGNFRNGLAPETAPNSELSWEKTGQVNIGFDAEFFKRKLTLGFDYYNSITKDLLLDVPIPSASGYSTMLKNVGKVTNKGIEVSLSTQLIAGDFEWKPSLNFSANRNKVLELGPGQEQIIKTNHITEIGHPIGSFYGYNIIGVFKDQADIDSYPHLTSARPGSYKYEDIKPDQQINSDDRKILGSPFPNWTAGFSNNFKYKDFDASFFVQTSQGIDIVNRLRSVYYINGEGWANATRELYYGRYISPENPGTGFAKNRVRPTDSNHQSSNYMIEDGSFIRIRNIVLGYSIPAHLISKWKIDRLRIYVSAQNPFTFTKYSGFNPEVSQNGSDALQPGMDYGSYPASKTLIFGLNLNF